MTAPKAGPPTPARIKSWRKGPEGFQKWVKDMKPRILKADGRYEPIELEPWQAKEITPALERNPDGSFKAGTVVLCWPRRHSKSVINVLVMLWRAFCWQHQNIKVLATTEKQILGTSFKLARNIIKNTPELLAQVGKDNLSAGVIRIPSMGNEIEAVAANEAALYGQKINLVLMTELHAAADTAALDVLSSSVGDSIDGQVLIDSTTDGPGGPIARLEELAKDPDSGCYVSRIEYADLGEALAKSPGWIRRSFLKGQHASLLPAVFASQHLNKRSEALNNLFRMSDVQAAMCELRCPVEAKDLPNLFTGRKWVAGGGLDRAMGFSAHGDNTVWTTVAKAARPDDGEAEYVVLNQQVIAFSDGRSIKREIAKDHERYGLQNIVLERYEAQDVLSWCQDARLPSEITHATTGDQTAAFLELHRIISQGRLRFSRELLELQAELERFIYEVAGRTTRFTAPKGLHDDRVYSLVWAIYALRDNELQAYELPCIVCKSKDEYAKLCYLRTGELILTCSRDCEAHRRVEAMHLQYTRFRGYGEVTLPEFFKAKVKVKGAIIRPGV